MLWFTHISAINNQTTFAMCRHCRLLVIVFMLWNKQITPSLFSDLSPEWCNILLENNPNPHHKEKELEKWYEIRDLLHSGGLSFTRHQIDPYFDWLQHCPFGTTKLQMLLNKAKQRSIHRIHLPGGEKYNDLKRIWEDLQIDKWQ